MVRAVGRTVEDKMEWPTILAWGSLVVNLACMVFYIRARKRTKKEWQYLHDMGAVLSSEVRLLQAVRRGRENWPEN